MQSLLDASPRRSFPGSGHPASWSVGSERIGTPSGFVLAAVALGCGFGGGLLFAWLLGIL